MIFKDKGGGSQADKSTKRVTFNYSSQQRFYLPRDPVDVFYDPLGSNKSKATQDASEHKSILKKRDLSLDINKENEKRFFELQNKLTNELTKMQETNGNQLNYKSFQQHLLKHLELIKIYKKSEDSMLKKYDSYKNHHDYQVYKDNVENTFCGLRFYARKEFISFWLSKSSSIIEDPNFSLEASQKNPVASLSKDSSKKLTSETLILHKELKKYIKQNLLKKAPLAKLLFKEYRRSIEWDTKPHPYCSNPSTASLANQPHQNISTRSNMIRPRGGTSRVGR